MLEQHLTLNALAQQLGHDPSVVSKAINHGRFPRVLEKAKKALNG